MGNHIDSINFFIKRNIHLCLHRYIENKSIKEKQFCSLEFVFSPLSFPVLFQIPCHL